MEGKNAVSTRILSLANSLLTSGESCNGSILTIICDNLEHNKDFQRAKKQIPKGKICTLNCTLEELALLNFIKESPKCNAKRNSCTYRKIRMNGKDDDRKIICTRHS